MSNGQGEGQWEARRDETWAFAWQYGEGFIKSAGVAPRKSRLQLTEEDVARLAYAVQRRQEGERSQKARVDYPFLRERFLEQWNVPESERKGWRYYPVEPAGEGAFYEPTEKRVTLGSAGAKGWASGGGGEDVLAHELAHATYFEQMPESMRGAYPLAHQIAQKVSPEYREAAESYGPSPAYPGVEVPGKLPIEGYAQTYEHLGKQPEKMPWYMEPFYGNLMYEVPDLPRDWEKNWAVHLGYWLKNRLEKANPKVQSNWADFFKRTMGR